MLAKMARIDLDRLRADGFSPSDEQVVRLNDLAIRIESGKNLTVANAPRVAYAGNICLFEPTFAALEWWSEFGRDAAWTTAGKLDTYYFCLSHARDLESFEGLVSPRAVRAAVRKWKRSVVATDGELWRALLYVKRATDEMPAADHPKISDDESRERLYRLIIAASGAIGVSPDSLRTQTPTTLMALLTEANIHARIPMKQSVAADYIAYQQLIREIESSGDNSSSQSARGGRNAAVTPA